jgi:hypothetical protein
VILIRLFVVLVLVFGFALARRLYRQWRAGLHTESRDTPRLPAALLDGAARTWVVFTTPYCATCEPVKQRLAAHDPDARVVTVDATREPFLAKAFHIRSAPTVLLADGAGDVRARLVGAAAVNDYVRSPA